MPVTVRLTGYATAVYDPAADRWIEPGGYSRTLTARSLWTDHAAAALHAESVRPLKELVFVSVDLAVDPRHVRKMKDATGGLGLTVQTDQAANTGG